MNILMVVAYFVPEIGSAAHVYYDLARAFIKRGHEVHVITSYPRKFNLNINDVDKEFHLDENINGIYVHRCKHLAQRDNIVLRGLEHFLSPRYYFKTFRKIGKKFDVCLIYIPPLPLYYFAKKIKRYNGTPSVLNYQDFAPQELTDVGVMKNKLLIKIMKHIEKESYKNADYITVLSNGGIDYIVKKGGNPNIIKHIYNSVLLSDFEIHLTKKDFKNKEGIENKTLISYAGILSPFQGVDNILDVAKKLSSYEDIIFYIVGDGMFKNHLISRIKDEKIYNVKFLPLQLREEYYNIINSSDISMVSLDNRMKAPCLPGKLINLMALKQPIIGLVPEDCETAWFIRNTKCGVVVKPGNIEELKNTILNLKDNLKARRDLGEDGRKFLEKNMNLEKNVIKYEKVFETIGKGGAEHINKNI